MTNHRIDDLKLAPHTHGLHATAHARHEGRSPGDGEHDGRGVRPHTALGLSNGLNDEVARARRAAIAPEDFARFEGYVAEILTAYGMDLTTTATLETPRRFVRALYDATEGYEGDPKLVAVFPTECYGGSSCELSQVVEGPIPFTSLCEHHALPFLGRAFVGYIAHEKIIGISKLTRLVRIVTRRFGVQERMTHQIAEMLAELTEPHGVAVYMEASHLCTQMRGVREIQAKTRTTAFIGAYEVNSSLRSEFYDLAGLQRGVRE
jgi:GTP cyclohydrolase I